MARAAMSAERWAQVKELLYQALQLAPEARERFLDEACAGAPLREEVESLLSAAADVGPDFLQSAPEADVGAEKKGVGHFALSVLTATQNEFESGFVGKLFGPYRVRSLLGQGGMGSVWLAERVDGLFTRQVALKLVHPALIGRVMSDRGTREREIHASLDHPNIARLIDAGFAADGQPYLALEYVAGSPLTTHCDNHRLSIRGRVELFRQVLSAVQYAHAHLVIHRDLKPSNVLVTEEGQVRLVDFGIAKILTDGEARETELTRLGGRAMTPDYAAPEQITGESVTIAADVYSLGVMLYELLTGDRPYRLKHPSRGALEQAILETEPRAPSRATLVESAAKARSTTASKLARVLDGDLDTIVMKALKKSATERYATVDAFDNDIARFLRGDAVLAQRDSGVYRFLKFTRRHWVVISAVCTLILTLAGGLAATTYEAHVAAVRGEAALQAQSRSLTQSAAARLERADVSGALGIILEVLSHQGANNSYTSEALNVFQLARAADAEIMALSGHIDRVASVAFSPDGGRLITASRDKTARIWNAATGGEILQLRGHTDAVNAAAFAPDGRRVVTASGDKTARVWDAVSGRQTLLLSGHTDAVNDAAFAPDGRRVVTTSDDKTARLWDAVSGRQTLLLSGHTDSVNAAGFSPDGRRVVTASDDKTARLWDAATGREIRRLSGHANAVMSAAFSPDARRVVTASFDKTVRVWDAATGAEVLQINGHTLEVRSAAFSPDGRRIVTGSFDKSARLWDAATGREILRLSGHTDQVSIGSFSPDGRRIATASADGTARLWDATEREIVLLTGHADELNSAMFSPDGLSIVTASGDKTARLWDAVSGREILLLSGHEALVISAAFSHDGQRVVTASFDKTARIWDVATGRQLTLLNGHTSPLWSAAFSPDGRRVVTASSDKTARIWDAETGRQLMLLSGHDGKVNSAAFSPDGRRIVTASWDRTARIWDAETGRQIMPLSGHTREVWFAAFSPDGRRVVTASNDTTARIWDAEGGREIMRMSGHTAEVWKAAFSSDGQRIVTSSADKTARVWDAATGRQIRLLRGHTEPVSSSAFSPDGQRIITASLDKTARIWEARTPALDIQIESTEAAQFDPLLAAERFQFGLLPTDARRWAANRSTCDQLAAAPDDPDRRAPGVILGQIVTASAVVACADRSSRQDEKARATYQHGRALMADGQFSAAAQDFEDALAGRYRSARVDLAMLLSQPIAGLLDLPRAVSLYEQAWKDGVTIAAFDLGNLYEHGVSRTSNTSDYLAAADNGRAWFWYRKGADAGEPHALARLAEKDDDAALSEENETKRKFYLLQSFEHYAAAAERARIEDWPDDAWRTWRYRRASLARVLARDGMTQEVADAYRRVRRQYTAAPTLWKRLVSFVGID